jgi:hypothetical protein
MKEAAAEAAFLVLVLQRRKFCGRRVWPLRSLVPSRNCQEQRCRHMTASKWPRFQLQETTLRICKVSGPGSRLKL